MDVLLGRDLDEETKQIRARPLGNPISTGRLLNETHFYLLSTSHNYCRLTENYFSLLSGEMCVWLPLNESGKILTPPQN